MYHRAARKWFQQDDPIKSESGNIIWVGCYILQNEKLSLESLLNMLI